MSLLLDTHVVLWWLADDPDLPEEIKDRLDHEPDIRVSTATIWEIAIKQDLGEISAPADLPGRVRESGFRELPIDFTNAIAAGQLPPIHWDPFGQMLVAQARELLSRPVDQDLLAAWAAGPLLGSGAADGSECLYRVLGEELGDDYVAQLGFLDQQAVRGARDDG
jgi:PIN domain nuclease of toxin-antitoxin system